LRRIRVIGLILAFALVATTSLASAQEAPTKALTVNPLGLILGIVSAEYEVETSPGTTMGLQGLYWNPDLGWDLDLSAIGGAIGFRKYATGQTLKGLYYGAYASFASVSGIAYDSWTKTWESARASVIGLFGVGGIKWLGSSGFVGDLGVSLGLPLVTTISSGNLSQTDIAGVMSTSISFSIGYAW
jgi:hypothetical protein